MYKKPVLFIIFNRPETTKKVFAEIRKYKPAKLFVAADGPRENKAGEKERCEQARKITENIDWPCKVKRLYRKKNLGCKYAVSGAIDWFFENVEEGIILEDDCLPDSPFFTFCEKMLGMYRNDSKVMCISGDNFLPKSMQKKSGYYFSKYVHIWGWATWRRAWKNYDVEMRDWLKIRNLRLLSKYFDNFIEKVYWFTIFNAVYDKKIDTWDYQFVYHTWKNEGLSIIPNTNLISNIGFDKDALHTKAINSPLSEMSTDKLKLDSKKVSININKKADNYSRKNVFGINLVNIAKQLIYYSVMK